MGETAERLAPRSRLRRLPLFLILHVLLAVPLLGLGFRAPGAFRVELGAMDELYRLGPGSAWGRPYEDSGPMRLRRGVRFPTTFAARMAFHEAALRLPAVVDGGAGELRLRMHRYGQPGLVQVFANGLRIGSLRFEEDSYPWDVRKLALDERFFRDDLVLSFRLDPLKEEVDLPAGAIAAFDWVELAPSDGARLSPPRRVWFAGLLLPLLVYALLLWSTSGGYWAEAGSLLTLVGIAAGLRQDGGAAVAALSQLWLAFPLGALVWSLLRSRAISLPDRAARGLTAAFTLALLAHSTVLFWPKHLPPDVRPHLRQLRRIGNESWSAALFWEVSSSYGKDGRTLALGRYHPEATYIAPYPPWSYAVLHVARGLLDRPRFLLEYLAMICAATTILFAYALARQLAADPRAPVFAAGLASLEISTWHHASRAHTPALFGQMLLLAAITYLAVRSEELHRKDVQFRLGLLSFLAAVSYGATLFHFVFLIAGLVIVSWWERQRVGPLLAATVGGTALSFLLFYRRFVGADAPAAGASVFNSEGYRAPASWWLLRNQTRDGLRILSAGSPLWTLLALPAMFRLGSWSSGAAARRLVLAWTGAYVAFLVLKDPFFFPRLLVQIKEDLFIAPLLSVLGGMTLSAVSRWKRFGTVALAALFVVMISLQINDFLASANTIAPPDSN